MSLLRNDQSTTGQKCCCEINCIVLNRLFYLQLWSGCRSMIVTHWARNSIKTSKHVHRLLPWLKFTLLLSNNGKVCRIKDLSSLWLRPILSGMIDSARPFNEIALQRCIEHTSCCMHSCCQHITSTDFKDIPIPRPFLRKGSVNLSVQMIDLHR